MEIAPIPTVGFACSYTPLPLIHAAGFDPYRILPIGDGPDQAATVLHDNLCPHVKRILDRRLAGDLPPLTGIVFVNSCDAMRRLANAFAHLDSPDRVALIDLPVTRNDLAVSYLAVQLQSLRGTLTGWAAADAVDPEDRTLARSLRAYNQLSSLLNQVAEGLANGKLPGGRSEAQRWYNRSVTQPVAQTTTALEAFISTAAPALAEPELVPVLLFGNVLPNPEALDLFLQCGARVVDEDLCTGARQLTGWKLHTTRDPLAQLAHDMLFRPPCPRTIDASDRNFFARHLLKRATEAGARGAIAHVMKFCDPYLVRMPALREAFRKEGLPLLVLEGDCTMRSLGQFRTRIEAFVEQLGG